MPQNPVRSTLNSALNLIRNTWCLAHHRDRDRWTRRSTSPCLLRLDSDSSGCKCPGYALPPTPVDAAVPAMLCLQLPCMQLSWPCFASNSYGCNCPGHADRADRLAGKATTTSDLLPGRSEVLRNLKHCLRVQSRGHYTIDRLEERCVERGSARRSSLKGRERAIVS